MKQAGPAQVCSRHEHLGQQLARCQRNHLPIAHFLQYDGITAPFKAGKDLVEKSHRFKELSF